MLEIDGAILGGWIGSLIWPLFRVGGLLMVAPIFGTQLVPARVRLVLAVVIAMLLAPNLPPVPQIDLISVPAFVLVAQQILIGVGMGFVLVVLLQTFVAAGQIIAMHMGLGFASMVDPTNGVSVTVLSQFHLMMMTLLFLVMNGHLVMIEVLADSFYALPVGAGFLSGNALWGISELGTWMFGSALLIALPVVASMLIINFSLGVITKAAPQLNIFAVGFPFMLVVGLCIIWVTMNNYLPQFDRYAREGLDFMATLAGR